METEYGSEDLRVIALENAVEFCRGRPMDWEVHVVSAAQAFHAFLMGEGEPAAEAEAHEPVDGDRHQSATDRYPMRIIDPAMGAVVGTVTEENVNRVQAALDEPNNPTVDASPSETVTDQPQQAA